MLQTLRSLQETVIGRLPKIFNQEELIEYKNSIFGKTGQMTEILKGVKDLSIQEKQTVGKATNELKNVLVAAFDDRSRSIDATEVAKRIATEYTDVTFPVADPKIGHLHPITLVTRQVEESFTRMGFEILESAEISDESKNFDTLNMPKSHSTRDESGAIRLEGVEQILATHVSSMQNEIYRTHKLPIRVAVLGQVFRDESGQEISFHQAEVIVVDQGISFANMKHVIRTTIEDIVGNETKIRYRTNYNPMVELGASVDISCSLCNGNGCDDCQGTGWIEFLECGLLHTNVLLAGGIDPTEYSGFAFAFGLEKLAMVKYGIKDMKYFQNPDMAFLKQF